MKKKIVISQIHKYISKNDFCQIRFSFFPIVPTVPQQQQQHPFFSLSAASFIYMMYTYG